MAPSSIHKSPLRYPGGKNCIYEFMKALLLENNLVGSDYAEPYAGGAGLALHLLIDGLVNTISINDLDYSIYAFWYAIKHYPDEMCEWIEKISVNLSNWYKYKEIQKNKENVDILDLAKSTFYLNRTNVSGVISGGPIGGMDQQGKYKINARFNKKDLINRILNISDISDKIYLYNIDGIEFINHIENNGKNNFIYLDPPYFNKGSYLYLNAFKISDHKSLSQKVSQLTCNWLVSYDNNETILNLYSNYNIIRHKLSQCTSNRIGDEVLIFDNLIINKALEKLKNPLAI